MNTYLIPAVNLAGLLAKIEKLAKRARKIGVPAPTITVGPAIDKTDPVTGIGSRFHEVQVSGEAPKYDGWSLTAVIELDHAEPDAPNVVGVVPGTPEHLVHVDVWRLQKETCDHCHVDNRRRKTLVVVTHENEEQKIVGSTCLKDFLGHTSPDAIASWAQVLADLDDVVQEFTNQGERAEWRLDPVKYLAWVALAIRTFGWTPRSRATVTQDATSDTALSLMVAYAKQTLASADKIDPPTDADEAEALAAWDWAATVSGNDYLDNIAAVAAKQSLRTKHLGLAASIVSGYQREQGRAAERAAKPAASTSTHLGKPGEKITFVGEVVFVHIVESDWGPKAMVKIVTPDGNVIVWWCSNPDNAPDQGVNVTGSAKVKAHDFYQGTAQTTVTFAKLAVVDAPAAPVPAAPITPAAPAAYSPDPAPAAPVGEVGKVVWV